MIKILFVCHGNICRSTMAEAMFKEMVDNDEFEIDSAAVSREEIGNAIYPPAARKLREKGVPTGNHRARQVTRHDYEYYDYLICMDDWNIRLLMKLLGGDPKHKICKLLEFTGSDADIADPWYTGDFETTYNELVEGLNALLANLKLKKEEGKGT